MKFVINGVSFDPEKDNVAIIWDNDQEKTKTIVQLQSMGDGQDIQPTTQGTPRMYAVGPKFEDLKEYMDRALKIYRENTRGYIQMTW